MRILFHGVFPAIRSGYGGQCGLIARGLRDLGHDVALSVYTGLIGAPGEWDGIPVYPAAVEDHGMDVLADHYRHWGADALITLTDTWCIVPDYLIGKHLNMAFITPVDCDPLSSGDESVLRRTHALPLAISQHGMRMMEAAYFKPMYTPHGIDTGLFAPPADRDALRSAMGFGGRFVIGINSSNADGRRKGFDEQFQAFAAFHAKHPDSVLSVHTVANNKAGGGIDLHAMANRLGLKIGEDVEFSERHATICGMVPDQGMAEWYGALDVLSNCAQGEGFGLPIVEAQGCGTPVVVTSCSSMPELCGAGWKVPGDRRWHQRHDAYWASPRVDAIVTAWEHARQAGPRKRAQAREFALRYEIKRVMETYWPPVLDVLGGAIP